MKLKSIALLLAAALLLICTVGCGAPASQPTPSPAAETPAPTDIPEESPEPTPSPDPEAAARLARYTAIYEKYSPDAVVMRVDGEPVLWSEYFSWIYTVASELETAYGITDWSADPSFAAYLGYYADLNSLQISVINKKAVQEGADLTAAQEAEFEGVLQLYYDNFGGEEGFAQYLADSFLTPEYFESQTKAMTRYNNLYEAMFGESGAALPEADALQYLEDQGYLFAKHILFKTVDDSYQNLDETALAEKRAAAENVLAQLQACAASERAALFDSLMEQYNEDPGMRSYPDGYYFLAGEMVAPFEEAARSLDVNEISGLVESDYGYHILYRPAMSADHVMGYDSQYQPYTPRSYAAAALFGNVTDDWFDNAQVVYTPEFENFDFVALMADE